MSRVARDEEMRGSIGDRSGDPAHEETREGWDEDGFDEGITGRFAVVRQQARDRVVAALFATGAPTTYRELAHQLGHGMSEAMGLLDLLRDLTASGILIEAIDEQGSRRWCVAEPEVSLLRTTQDL